MVPDNIREKMTKLPKIIAVDFDGCMFSNTYPVVGKPNAKVLSDLRIAHLCGTKIILWTSRDGQPLVDAVAACAEQGVPLDAVNKNVQEVIDLFGSDTRKVYADEYWDDKSVLVKYGVG